MANIVEKFWDKASDDYSHKQWQRSAVSIFDFDFTKKYLLRNISPQKTDYILEIGCGPGKWTEIISKKCKKMTAVDISSNMLKQARKRCKSNNITFIHGNIEKIKISKNFEKIFAVRSIEYMKNKHKLIKKLYGMLAKNGRLVIITKSRPCMWDITKKVDGFWQEKISYRNLEKICKEVGFKKVKVMPVIIRLPVFANGNREFRILRNRQEKAALFFFKSLTEKLHNTNSEIIRKLSMLFSESYIVFAEKT